MAEDRGRRYARAGVPEHFTFLLQPETAHKVTEAAEQTALDWLTKQLLR